jgi:hypothetical protein
LVKSRKLAQALDEEDIPLCDAVVRILQKHPQASRLLLIIDQFEELYTLCPDARARHAFIDLLLQPIPLSVNLPTLTFLLLPSPTPHYAGRLHAASLDSSSLR